MALHASGKRVAAFLLAIIAAAAHAQNVQCPDGKPADGLGRAGSSTHCLVALRFEPPRMSSAAVLVVYLHGDNGGRIDLRDDRGTAAGLAAATGATTISLQRPGYSGSLGKSDGFSDAGDNDYTPGNVEIIADALKNLRAVNPGKKILLIGHSGGSAMTALVAARFPASADAWLLAGCPCDVPSWRLWRNSSAGRSGTWDRSLSPLAEAGKVPAATRMGIVVGSRDDNTLPKFSEAYASALQAVGVKTRVTYAVGATHSSVRWSPELLGVAQDLAGQLAALPAR